MQSNLGGTGVQRGAFVYPEHPVWIVNHTAMYLYIRQEVKSQNHLANGAHDIQCP